MNSLDIDQIASRSSWIGRGMRWPLDRIPKGMAMPILSGPLRTRRWIVGAGIHRCWLGTYERRKQTAILQHLEKGMIACDVGANTGFYSLLMSKAVGVEGTVYAFEPGPENLRMLTRHLELNAVHNVVTSPEAIADFVGEASFANDRGSYQGRLESGGCIKVPVVTLDHLLNIGRIPPPDLLKIDVEGAEFGVLQGARAMIKRFRPVLFLATHGAEVHQSCCDFLKACGYRLRTLEGDTDVSRSDEIIASTR